MSMAVELWAMQLERPLTAEETEVLTALLPSGRRGTAGTDLGRGPAAGAALRLLHLYAGRCGNSTIGRSCRRLP